MIHDTVLSVRRGVGVALLALLLCSGCDLRKPAWRSYEEVHLAGAAQHRHEHQDAAPPQQPAAPAALAWTCPDGWTESAGSGMRMATFVVESGDQTATCTLVRLSGAAGGLEANVRRWIGQLGLAMPDDAALAAFLGNQLRLESDGGFSGTVVDLSGLGTASDGSSMLAALVDIRGATLFVKMTGPAALLAAQKEQFIALCQSLRQDS